MLQCVPVRRHHVRSHLSCRLAYVLCRQRNVRYVYIVEKDFFVSVYGKEVHLIDFMITQSALGHLAVQ